MPQERTPLQKAGLRLWRETRVGKIRPGNQLFPWPEPGRGLSLCWFHRMCARFHEGKLRIPQDSF